MLEKYQSYEASIKKKHVIAWSPKFQEETRTSIPPKAFPEVVIKVFNDLDWEIVYVDLKVLVAKRKSSWKWDKKYYERITVTYDYGKVIVQSESIENHLWDNGSNSRLVRLFIYAFKETEATLDRTEIAAMEAKVNKDLNMEDYIIPERLTPPKQRKPPRIAFPVLAALIIALFLGFFMALGAWKIGYYLIAYELAAGFAIGYALSFALKAGNYVDFDKLSRILIITIVLTLFLSHYFYYQLVNVNEALGLDFFSFMGLVLDRAYGGWIIFILLNAGRFYFARLIANMIMARGFIDFQLERVPVDVLEFAFYHFSKSESEASVRYELSKMNWSNKEDQDDVFFAMAQLHELREASKTI